ncbi:bifunctional Dephospho-CoA kinase/P-loop containing nucleoside triphosphate hydrolase [Babesia duncani]|uniref:Bifunctional Dephospho-CoA kinase/P-loop containing nucleoside triphosphate hydrolase n=1 Tax=Babesia duncani TaxID=323732 RepID=A0AAD9PLN0_9APIC|nr:bifunctional Dephospho-CoA kinase/P-loop containing nucleoside triphosphate hydrolase [Babesia duncani]
MVQYALAFCLLLRNFIDFTSLVLLGCIVIYDCKLSFMHKCLKIRLLCLAAIVFLEVNVQHFTNVQLLLYHRGLSRALLGIGVALVARRLVVTAITGGIGSGKSTLCKYLSERGYIVIDADEINRKLLVPGSAAYDTLISKFGAGIVLANGEIDRDTLREIVFNDENKRRTLNRCMHWYIGLSIVWLIVKHRVLEWHPRVVLEVPLLYGSPLEFLCGPTVVIAADQEIRLERCRARTPNVATDTLLKIMRSQTPTFVLAAWGDLVIENNGDLDTLCKAANVISLQPKNRSEWSSLLKTT